MREGCTRMRPGIVRIAALLAVSLSIFMPVVQISAEGRPSEGRPVSANRQVAVVIDDFGNGMTGTEEMFNLPIRFTAAVMPFMPTTKRDAQLAHERGLDIIVHMPMEPNRGKRSWLGPGAITTDLPDEEIRRRVEAAIADVPFAIGMNNHMGSKATSDERVMRIVLSVVKEHGMFFLDSRTTGKSVIPKLAAELGVPQLSNHVFLDDVYTAQHIAKQMGVVEQHLSAHEACVTIGHVGPPGKKTAAVLRESIPQISQKAVFVKLSELLVPSPEKDIIPHP